MRWSKSVAGPCWPPRWCSDRSAACRPDSDKHPPGRYRRSPACQNGVLAETGIGVGGIQVERQPGVQRELGTDAAPGPAGFRVARVADEHDLGADLGSAPLGRTRNGVRDAGSAVTSAGARDLGVHTKLYARSAGLAQDARFISATLFRCFALQAKRLGSVLGPKLELGTPLAKCASH